ncbi:hypothetical protein FT663_00604 [Candidozyma haemuli var. vulneris]|uniref:Uncharacterized protein n=1 Tax=Candidozyma haemuli TaxID=45357 RepID=A0A2V1ARH0_9ASCO|nr:hypothetical protein CXQ85_003387 [[Candida] haemuloni]KAF3989018.1 hypothetical protein FT662_03079 [[Candida] haemuloni var. vulneris]KAF3995226.1 hypothetical protein FT663_00604 [[Candida] haemuloni var. vulneris]PVH19541.1 hypothetical protein CXQ85_003387 [[Candida] haemuloni]
MLMKIIVFHLAFLGTVLTAPAPAAVADTPESIPEFKDLSFVESLIDFASQSQQFVWDPASDKGSEEGSDGSDDEGEQFEEALDAEPSVEEPEQVEQSMDDEQMNDEQNVDDEITADNNESLNNTVHSTNMRIETGLFFDVRKGDEDCSDSDSDYDDDCDDDDERGLLKKILFFLPSSVQQPKGPKANTTEPNAANTAIPMTTYTNHTTANLVTISANALINTTGHSAETNSSLSRSSPRQSVPRLDDIYRLMESSAPATPICWIATALLILV